MSEPLRVALLGYGLGGRVFHAPFIAAEPAMKLAAIVVRDPGRRAQAAADHPQAELLSGADEVWQRSDALDLVVVTTPNASHVPLALEAVGAGLAVVVDKPLAATAADAQRVVAAAQERGVLLSVFQNRRWDGDFLTLRELIDEGQLGDVLRLESRFERFKEQPGDGWRDRPAAEEAGGLLYDLGAHLIDQALVLLGPVANVYAELDVRRPGAQVVDDAFVALAHATGARSHLWMSATAADAGPRLRVLGSHAAYVKHGLDVQEDVLRREGAAAAVGAPGWGAEPEERWGTLGRPGDARPVPTQPGAYQRFYAGMAAALRDGAPVPVDPRDAIAALDVIEAAQLSAAERRVVAIR